MIFEKEKKRKENAWEERAWVELLWRTKEDEWKCCPITFVSHLYG